MITENSIFWPMIAQVTLVILVWLRMYQRRLLEMYSRRIDPQSVAVSAQARETLRDMAAEDNFRNLFEVPVLFFAVCLSLAVTDTVSAAQLYLAWAFVALRVVHTTIHTTYNRVVHRFIVHVTSTVCVFAMWVLFALALIGVAS